MYSNNWLYMFVVVLRYTMKSGSNCPLNDVTASLSSCVQASTELGYTCDTLVAPSKHTNKPAGCFYTSPEHSRFNKIISPSKTVPENDKLSGGICSMISMVLLPFRENSNSFLCYMYAF